MDRDLLNDKSNSRLQEVKCPVIEEVIKGNCEKVEKFIEHKKKEDVFFSKEFL